MPDGSFDILFAFHEGEANIKCDRGLDDPLITIKPYLEKAGWQSSVEEYFNRQYEFEKKGIDFDLLSKIQRINKEKAKCFIGSNQNCHRKEYLKKEMKLNEIFEDTYFSCDIGYVKPENEYWENAFAGIAKYLPGIMKRDVFFLDDRKENIESANDYGFTAIHINNRDMVNGILEEELF